MQTFKKVLNGKGLLTASIAMLSGHAMAEVAGRVSFVSGDARVTAADGNSRALQRGEAINGGDRITTRAGRVQIRFTDGGFVSLQPNTVFGVDEYLYTNRKPEETSLFFSLVQGGMRTITGAIGKVNKKSYQVRTPVATIGIRGTEYLAQVGERGLIVSVGKGLVNVANGGGDITAGARQNIRVTGRDASPVLTEEKVELLSTRSSGREKSEDEEESRDRRTVTIADVQNNRGDYLFLFTTKDSLADSVPPAGPEYTLLSPGGFTYGSRFFADFDQNGSESGTTGGLLELYPSSDSTLTNHAFDSGTLQVTNSGTIGALSWGEFTNGDATTNNVFVNNPLSLSDTQYLPYVIGAPSEKLLPKGFATYTLQGATPARDVNSGAVGTVDSFVIKVNLDLAALDARLKLTMPDNSYTVSTLQSIGLNSGGIANFALAGSGSNNGFSIYDYQLGVTDSNGACASSGACSASIEGFFAGLGGSQIGTSYSLNNSLSNANIQGVAALGLSGLSANAPYLPDSSAGVDYLVASPDGLNYGLRDGTPAYASFDRDGSLTGTIGGLASLYFSTYAGSPSFTSSFGSFDSGTLQVTNSGTISALTWGELTNGEASSNSIFQCYDGCPTTPLSLASTQFVPYILGAYPNGNLGKGSAVYTLQGKTPARDSYYGRVGTLDNFTIKVNLDFASVEAGFRVSLPATSVASDVPGGLLALPANSYTAQTNGPVAILNLGTAANFSLYSMQVTDTAGTCNAIAGSSSCYASIDAFFAGDASQQIGASYTLDGFGTTPVSLSGVAALGLSIYNPDSVLASGPHYSLAFAAPQYTGVAGGFVDQSLTVNFDAAQLMTTATGFDPATSTYDVTIMDRQNAQAADAGQVGALKWGRWYSAAANPATVTANTSPVQVGGYESLHYIVGPMTQPAIFAGVVSAYGENATATYTYQGGSFATGSDGILGSVTPGSTLTMTFSSVNPTLALDVGIDMQSGNDYQIGGVAQLGLDATASKFSAISGSGASCGIAGGSTSCSAMISGFFAGQQAQQVGLGYRVDDGSRVVNGAAAFGRGDIASPVLLP